MQICPFGEIDPKNVEEYYEGRLTIENSEVEVDLNFESKNVSEAVLSDASNFLSNSSSLVSNALKSIESDFDLEEESETARFYLSHHLDVCEKGEIVEFFGNATVDKQCFMSKLKAVRIGIYPEDKESFAVIDVKFPNEFSNYLMAVIFDSDGTVQEIAMES